MIRILVEQTFVNGKKYIEAAGTSNDTPPEDNLVTGSSYIEVDTGKAYLFDETAASGSRWKEV
jgi:hypothetical protein